MVEAAGIPTVALGNMADRLLRVRVPRGAAVKFPRGAPCGPPGADELQRRVLTDAFRVLESASTPGTVVELPYGFQTPT